MSAGSTVEVGEFDLSSYGWATSQYTTIEENWWIKHGRFVEFQLIFTSGRSMTSGQTIAKGSPKPFMAGTFACLGSIAKVAVYGGQYTSDTYGTLKTVTAISSGVRTVLHGVYISES